MIGLHVILLIVAGLFGAVVQFAVMTVYFQPKKRRRVEDLEKMLEDAEHDS